MNHNKPQHEPLRADSYLRRIYTSAQYRDTLTQGNFSTAPYDEQQHLRNQALGRAANFLVKQNTSQNQYVTPEGSLYHLMGQLGSAYHARKELEHMEAYGHAGNRQAILAQKERVINFNHSLRDVIDKHPDVNARELLNFMGKSFEHLHGARNVDDFMYVARGLITGMQHEVIAEQIIGAIDDDSISYEETDLQGELRGADLYITIDDFRFPVDIKSSQRAVQRSVERHGEDWQLWSGVPQEKLGNRFRLTHKEASQYAGDMRTRLFQIKDRLQRSNRRIS